VSELLHIVCPHCDAVNRLAVSNLGKVANCGMCHQVLFTSRPLELDAARFQKHMQYSAIPLLVDFWAPWCGPCKMMAPQFAQAAVQLEPRMRLIKVNTEIEQMLGSRFNIRSIPSMVLFRNGAEAGRLSGAMGTAEIVRWANSLL